MYKPTGRPERQQGDETMQSARRAPWIVRGISTEFGRRHVRGVAVTRSVVAIWLVALGSVFCASGHYWGALLFVAAALNGSLAYLMPRWKAALDAENARTT